MSHSRSWLLLCLLFAMLAISGCTQPMNDRITLGGSYLSPSLAPDSMREPPKSASLFEARVTPDRSRWRVIQFIVPFDGAVHTETLRVEPPLLPSSTARFYGRYPSGSDVLDPQSHSWVQDLGFTCSELGRSLLGSPFLIGYMAWHGDLTRPSLSPKPYKRTQQNDWSSGSPATPAEIGDQSHD